MTDEERRYAAFAAVEEARKRDDAQALGQALIRLSLLARELGLGSGNAAFSDAAFYGLEAVEIYRSLGKSRDLAIALRTAAVPFTAGVDAKAMLLESIQLAESLGDREQEAHGRLAFGRTLRDEAEVLRAGQIFADLEDPTGEAFATQCYAIQASVAPHEKAALLERSADLFLQGGHAKGAYRSLIVAEVYGQPELNPEERLRLLERALLVAPTTADRAAALRCLTRVAEETGKMVAVETFRAQQDALDIELYGGRVGRLKHDLAMYTELIETASRKEKKDLKAKISTLRNELNTLSEG